MCATQTKITSATIQMLQLYIELVMFTAVFLRLQASAVAIFTQSG